MHCDGPFSGRKNPTTRIDIFIYIYIYNFTKMMDMSIYSSYVLNFYALLSALFRQKDSWHPYWNIKYIYIYINIYIYDSKRILEIRIYISYVLNNQIHYYRLLLGRKIFTTHIGVYSIYIYIYDSKRIMEISISFNYILNIYALFSFPFR